MQEFGLNEEIFQKYSKGLRYAFTEYIVLEIRGQGRFYKFMHSITSNDHNHTMIVAFSSVTPPECKTKSVPKKASVPPSENVPPKRKMCPKRKQQDLCYRDTFAIKTYFLVFIPEYTFVPNQNCLCPTLKHITLALGLHP